MDTEKNCLCWQKIIPAGKMGKENVLKYSGRDLKSFWKCKLKTFLVLTSQCANLDYFKTKIGLVCKRLSQIAVLSCCWRTQQQHKTAFPPPCYLHHSGMLFHLCLSPVQQQRCVWRKCPRVCFHQGTPWARQSEGW